MFKVSPIAVLVLFQFISPLSFAGNLCDIKGGGFCRKLERENRYKRAYLEKGYTDPLSEDSGKALTGAEVRAEQPVKAQPHRTHPAEGSHNDGDVGAEN